MTDPIALPSGTRGAVSELVACTYLMERGWHVFRAVSPACPVDLMAWKPGSDPVRVEVKTMGWQTWRGQRTPNLPRLKNDHWNLLLVVDGAQVFEAWAPITTVEILTILRRSYGLPDAVSQGTHPNRRRWA